MTKKSNEYFEICPDGYTLNGNVCYSDNVCPSGTTFHSPDSCKYNNIFLTCPANTTMKSNLCFSNAIQTCPNGANLLPGGSCVTSPQCATGTNFNSTKKRCEGNAQVSEYSIPSDMLAKLRSSGKIPTPTPTPTRYSGK